MLEINLLPEEEREKIFAKRISLFFTSFIIPISILIIILCGALFFLGQYLKSQNNSLEDQIQEVKGQKAQFSEIRQNIEDYNQIVGLIDNLSKYKTDWTKILSELASFTPSKIQITKFDYGSNTNTSSSGSNATNSATITGITKSLRLVILLKEKLANSQEFQNPVLVSAVEDQSGGLNFEISVKIKNVKNLPSSSQSSSQSSSSTQTQGD